MYHTHGLHSDWKSLCGYMYASYLLLIHIPYIPVLIIVHAVCVFECINCAYFLGSLCATLLACRHCLRTAANLQSWRKQLQCRYISK